MTAFDREVVFLYRILISRVARVVIDRTRKPRVQDRQMRGIIPPPSFVSTKTIGMGFVIEDVILDEDEEEFFLVQLIDEASADI